MKAWQADETMGIHVNVQVSPLLQQPRRGIEYRYSDAGVLCVCPLKGIIKWTYGGEYPWTSRGAFHIHFSRSR